MSLLGHRHDPSPEDAPDSDSASRPRRLIGAAVALLAIILMVGWILGGGREELEPEVREAPAPPVTRAPASAPSEPAAEAPPAAPAARPSRPAARRAPPAPEEPAAPVEAAPTTGTLRIESDVSGAQVFLDRVFVGTTPVTASGIAPGRHRLNVSAPGYEGHAETVQVEAGPRDILIKFKEVRLDASIDVVHKHRFGACRGRLSATPRGLRYETDDRNDTFAAQLLALETFEVDYLDKNLRVKPRGGRTYNFTHPDENADRLFVFHRDVEKARQRLAKGDPPAARD